MAYFTRAGGLGVGYAVVQTINLQRQDLAKARSLFHADVTSVPGAGSSIQTHNSTALTVSAANATSLATSLTLANQLKQYFNVHRVDTLAHVTSDTTNTVSTADATDLTTVIALANAIKTAFNAHLTQASVHCTNDGTNTVATANATDQTTANTLLNALKTSFNAHIQSAPAGASIQLL